MIRLVLLATTVALFFGVGAQAQTVYNTSLHDQPGTTTTTDATGTRTTSSGKETGPSYVQNVWQQADVASGGTVGITTDYASNGNGSVFFSTSDAGSKADLTDYIASYPSQVSLQSLTGLSYDYFRSSSSTTADRYAPVIRLDLNYDGGFGGSLVLENYYQNNQAATTDAWTTLNASLTNGLFYATNSKLGTANAGANGGLMTLQSWINQNSGHTINVYGVEVGVGSGWDGTFSGGVDNVKFAFAGGPSADANFEVADAAVSSAPEPGTWALMMLGAGAVGAMLSYRKRVIVDHKENLAAIG